MTSYVRISTSAEVWAVIRARHTNLVVFGSYSAPDGDEFGDPSMARMDTSYGFPGASIPIIEASTRWEIDRDKPYERINEHTDYWICVGDYREPGL